MPEVDVEKWGWHTIVTKDLVRDSAIPIDEILEYDFRRSLPADYEMLDEKPTFEWVDLDEQPDPFSGFELDDGTEIPAIENAYRVRGTARVYRDV